MTLPEVQRERRQIRMEILRCRRAGVTCDDSVMSKKRRLDECYPGAVSVVSRASSVEAVEMDANKVRQLRNRESAERSRQKKDALVDSLTCQVCELFVQLTDLVNENNWLQEQQAFALGGRSPCGSESFVAEEASVHSAITSCDEFDSDSDGDDVSVCSAPVTSSPLVPTSSAAPYHPYKLAAVSPCPSSPTYTSSSCSGSSSLSSSFNNNNQCSSTGYFDDLGDDVFADMMDDLDTWFAEENSSNQMQLAL